MTAVLAASAALAFLSAAATVSAVGEPSADEPADVVAPADTVPETVPDTTTTTTLPAETGEIDGVEVAVGLPPVPPVSPVVAPPEVGTVDGVEVAVGTPPVPAAVSTGSGRQSGQSVESPSPERSDVSIATLRIEAVVAATQLIESIQTIDVLLDAWA